MALFGAAAALVVGALLPRRLTGLDRIGPIAAATAALAILPVALHGFTHWDERPTAGRGLTPGLVRALRDRVPEKAVVFSDDATSYAIAAFAPVYVANALPGHVADTKANRPYERRADARQFFRTGDLAIPRRYGATWLVVDRNRSKLRPDLPQVYSDPQVRALPSQLVKVLLVSLYFPPAGGGGVQRTLKTATHLPGARDRDARARSGRPEVGAPRRRARVADAGVGPPGALRRPARPPAGRGAARQAGPRARPASRRGCSAGGCSSPTRT